MFLFLGFGKIRRIGRVRDRENFRGAYILGIIFVLLVRFCD